MPACAAESIENCNLLDKISVLKCSLSRCARISARCIASAVVSFYDSGVNNSAGSISASLGSIVAPSPGALRDPSRSEVDLCEVGHPDATEVLVPDLYATRPSVSLRVRLYGNDNSIETTPTAIVSVDLAFFCLMAGDNKTEAG